MNNKEILLVADSKISKQEEYSPIPFSNFFNALERDNSPDSKSLSIDSKILTFASKLTFLLLM